MTIPLVRPPAWTERATCRGTSNPDLFHPDSKPGKAVLNKAREFCGMCPVITQCRALAVATGSKGIWAGQWFPGETGAEKKARLHAEVIERVERGETDESIARMMGTGVEYVETHRMAAGLPANLYENVVAQLPMVSIRPGKRRTA